MYDDIMTQQWGTRLMSECPPNKRNRVEEQRNYCTVRTIFNTGSLSARNLGHCSCCQTASTRSIPAVSALSVKYSRYSSVLGVRSMLGASVYSCCTYILAVRVL